MKIILQNKSIKNKSVIELGEGSDATARVEKKCLASRNKCLARNEERYSHALSKNVPYYLSTGLPPETHYTSVYKSSYSKFVLNADSKKSSLIQDNKMISNQFCSFRKY